MRTEEVGRLQVGFAQPLGPFRTRWQYLMIEVLVDGTVRTGEALPANLAGTLERLGAAEWELTALAAGREGTTLWVFKRPVWEDSDA